MKTMLFVKIIKALNLFEINGRNSCTGNSRHIDVKFFWVKDHVDKKEVKIEYLPTHIMLADFFTKAIQGTLFTEFRKYIMGWKPMCDLIVRKNEHRIKEDVE